MSTYEDNVFLNVPFDKKYKRLLNALVFAVHDCGFVARSALEIEDSGQARVEKILNVIAECKFGIHDISRAGIDRTTGLPRFNDRYERFRAQLPAQAHDVNLEPRELTFGDYTHLVVGWLSKTPW